MSGGGSSKQRQLLGQRQHDSADQDELAVELGNMARDLQQQSQEDLMAAIVWSAVELIPGVDGGSISVVTGRENITSQAPTSEVPDHIDAIQMAENQGPCLDAAYEEQMVKVPDLNTEQRWPAFSSRAAAETKARGMLTFQLFVEDDNLGALNLYSTQPNAFTEESEHIGLLVAAHAAVAFADSRQVAQLNEAIARRDVIGQAKGILMERYTITSEQAFLLLAEASSRTNRKLHDLAEHLAVSGELSITPG